ncbi:MtrAB system accessory lipoprotein LpqB [Nocardia carnea]|uniref:MtrAB system accessory lipoprotein LpqB n=1 Tax=Nocardia carnea TaxID=37328 RepID=UPI002455545A|nr:MtrAB system accessory lipoprotein LpqB [Nocardia carnea]
MTVRPPCSRWFRLVTAVVAVAGMMVVAGCANLPDSSQPQALGTINQEPTAEGPPSPMPGRDPDLLLRDFLQATADPTDGHLAARQYMTPAASTQWNDEESHVIVERADTLRESRSENEATYVLRARKVGELAEDGSYHVADGIIEHKIEMTRVDGEWRIDELPDGVVMEYTAFTQSYRRHALYFVTGDGRHVTPDLRWISVRPDDLTRRLIDMLIAGPQSYIAPVVRNYLSPPAAVRGTITKANGDPVGVGVGLGGVRIDFSGIGELSPRDRELFAAQVVLTLSAADVLGPYILLADGRPLDERFADGGWSVTDLGAVADSVRPETQVGLHALRDGTLVEVESDGGPRPAPGYFGTVQNLQSVGLSPDGKRVAAVADAGREPPEPQRTLMMGSYGGDAFPVEEGGTITRPSWTADGSAAWAVVDGNRVIRAVTNGETGTVLPQGVDTTELFAGDSGTPVQAPITELRISRNGVSAALIADGNVYIAMVVVRPDGTYALTSPRRIAIELPTTATALDWYSDDTIIIAGSGTVDPVRTVKIDGSGMSSLGGRNLTPPVRQVTASIERQYVADSRAVLELTRTPEGGDPYWREVPGLGADAVPILPG